MPDLIGDPTTLPIPDLPGFSTILGIRIAVVGEEGEQLVALGHHESQLRLLAAFNRCAAQFIGDEICPTYGRRVTVAHLLDRHVWAAWASNESCGDCPDEDDGFCQRCQAIADGDWYLTWSDEPGPNRFPVTVLHNLDVCGG